MVVPLLAPSLWGLFSRKIGGRAVWITGLSGFALGALIRFGFGTDGFLANIPALESLNLWVTSHANFLKTFTGVIFPVAVLAIIEWSSKGEDAGWKIIASLAQQESEEELQHPPQSNPIAAKVVAVCLAICGAMMFCLILANESSHGILAAFGTVLFLISGTIFYFTRGKS